MNSELTDKQTCNKPDIIVANGQYPSQPTALNSYILVEPLFVQMAVQIKY